MKAGVWVQRTLIDEGRVQVVDGDSKSRIWLRVNMNDGPPFMICGVYSPVVKRNGERKMKADDDTAAKKFWVELSSEVAGYVNKNLGVVVMGDMNARIGERVGDEKTNENGKRMINMCDTHDLRIMNTMRANGVMTRMKGIEKSILDYLIVDEIAEQNLVDMRVINEDMSSDHLMIEGKWKMERRVEQMKERSEEMEDTIWPKGGRGVEGVS